MGTLTNHPRHWICFQTHENGKVVVFSVVWKLETVCDKCYPLSPIDQGYCSTSYRDSHGCPMNGGESSPLGNKTHPSEHYLTSALEIGLALYWFNLAQTLILTYQFTK